MKKNQYGLFTAIAMIVGIVIGSGIFFKSDNILVATGGNVFLGVLVFVIAAISIIFGSLSVAELASRNNNVGGVIAYTEEHYGKSIACAFGWFHTFLYYPALIVVVGWVTGIYTCILFGIEGTLGRQMSIGAVVIVFLFIMNTLSAKIGGYFQNLSTVIKLIPLVVIAIAGIIWGDVSSLSSASKTEIESLSWITALAPIAFSFDGWIITTSVGHEIKNAKKNLPIALIVAPIFILAIYLIYFIGISVLVGPEQIMALGDAHVDVAAKTIFGPMGAKIIFTFVVISILGTANGLVIGMCRTPYSLAIRNMFPYSKRVSKLDEKSGMPVVSSIISFVICSVLFVAHYITQRYNLLPNSDISEIAITINYLLYILLYYKVLKMGLRKEIKSKFRGVFSPVMATIGSLIILAGSIFNPLFILYTVICIVVLVSAIIFWKKQETNYSVNGLVED